MEPVNVVTLTIPQLQPLLLPPSFVTLLLNYGVAQAVKTSRLRMSLGVSVLATLKVRWRRALPRTLPLVLEVTVLVMLRLLDCQTTSAFLQ